MDTNSTLAQQIEQACRSVAPLWPLKHFVAVNPFLGYADRSFHETAAHLKHVHGDYPLPKACWFVDQYASGKIDTAEIDRVLQNPSPAILASFQEHELPLTLESLLSLSKSELEEKEVAYQLATFSAYVDKREGSSWNHLLTQEAAKWCAAHYDAGQASWSSPWKELSFFEAWKQAIAIDQSLSCSGLSITKELLASLPDTPEGAIAHAITVLEIPQERVADILERSLVALTGWSGYLRYLDREQELRGSKSDHGLQLLAVLLSYEVILHANLSGDENRMRGWQRSLLEDPSDTGESALPLGLATRLIWQTALEATIEKGFQAAIKPQDSKPNGRPALQAVFCIDVRSERFRRALESVMPDAQTIGFAGFFGIPVEHHLPGKLSTQALCPALLAPPVKSAPAVSDLLGEEWVRLETKQTAAVEKQRSWKSFKDSASSCFTFVETIGLGYAAKIIKDAFGWSGPVREPAKALPQFAQAMKHVERVQLAHSILKGISLTGNFAKQVLICGHGGESANNPYASSLDCGACGGHAGDVNARLAADLLNDEAVRFGLEKRGILIPNDTRFIAGLHNTTTDEVTLFDAENEPTLLLERALQQAGDLCLMQRSLELDAPAKMPAADELRKKSRDWSQVRPEWGLAGNAAFIVAPRSWTQSSNLAGKAFLHEYDPSSDPQSSLLSGILGGPLVVGSWINLQYYASSTDNEVYGSGHKTIHNVMAGIGVALGNENDLRPGLPFQSVSNGQELVHTPCRLHACVATDPAELDKVLEQHQHLKDLVTNNWIHLIALGRDGSLWSRRLPDGSWSDSPKRLSVSEEVA